MSQKKISQYYIFSLVWIGLGIALAVEEKGFSQLFYLVSSLAVLFCTVDFFMASNKKRFLSYVTFLTVAVAASSSMLFAFL